MKKAYHRIATAGVMLTALAVAATGRAETSAEAVLKNYADVAEAMYRDALTTAEALATAVDALLDAPSEQTLAAARDAWRAARVPYQQTEGFRFGNAYVDDWEGKVNAWPLDEGLIDYVAASYGDSSDENPLYTANVIANTAISLGGRQIDVSRIDKALLADTLQEADEVETNVATGYHAIEFLLWGQDLNGTGPGAGERPASDFAPDRCSGGHCERRAAYLRAATELLIDDLRDVVAAWGENGAARRALLDDDPQRGLAAILTGLGSLSYGELAGERIKLGLLLNDPEEEHDCFSDNTHNSHYYNQVGMISIYTGDYRRVDGSTHSGPGLDELAEHRAAGANRRLLSSLDATLQMMQTMKDSADNGELAYDQMIGGEHPRGTEIVENVVAGLVDQTRAIEKLVGALDLQIKVEGSDSLDDPHAVQ